MMRGTGKRPIMSCCDYREGDKRATCAQMGWSSNKHPSCPALGQVHRAIPGMLCPQSRSNATRSWQGSVGLPG